MRTGEEPLLYQAQAKQDLCWRVPLFKKRFRKLFFLLLSTLLCELSAEGCWSWLPPLSAKPRLLSRALSLIQISIFDCFGLSTSLLCLTSQMPFALAGNQKAFQKYLARALPGGLPLSQTTLIVLQCFKPFWLFQCSGKLDVYVTNEIHTHPSADLK